MRTSTIGFIGLGAMGMPMARRLIASDHKLVVFDTRTPAIDGATTLGALSAASPAEVADRASTVLTSLPTPEASAQVIGDVAGGSRVKVLIDLSTIGSQAAQRNHAKLNLHNVAMLDCPVSGGVQGAQNGSLAMMASGPRNEFDAAVPILEVLGRPFYVSETPGAAQTMKLVNNMMAATSLAATAEVAVMGVKAGLDATAIVDVLNAGSGATHASREKFPRAVLPRSFDYGFATGLMVKDLRLYMQEAQALGLPTAVASAVVDLWETVQREEGAESDFTSVVKPLEVAAGVIVDGRC
ncbi:NAD(P)-dependent oxidoreductase [Mycolicibacillus parakoreensis]|uniref:NAD(P)-dependent oxidoreductase n=1 Tax=Mycolicibacillus parakoreensis TaxID=1069221 RepID=A0ABY3U9M6_9MYCO|nr:NAD(P)-dependent oxidoreductase [Mycolicibacillus parakoreensis]ULN54422.2 NAD(P)-dependent oxidoreductase [Mycolicibacillus parakoreensis]